MINHIHTIKDNITSQIDDHTHALNGAETSYINGHKHKVEKGATGPPVEEKRPKND